MFRIFYDLCLHLLLLLYVPKFLCHPKKYLKNLRERLGINFPVIKKQGRKLVWIHAVSLGETKAVLPLIKELKQRDPMLLIVLSCVTHTGYEAGKAGAADFHVYLPFDLPYVIRPIVKRIAPDLVVLTETDFWFHFQDAAKECGSKIALVNGKISEESFKRFLRFPIFARNLLHPIDFFFLQNQEYFSRFEALGIAHTKMIVTGNLKIDGMKIEATAAPEIPLLVLGSTHDPEERLWLSALKEIWVKFPQLKVMFAPRHPERFEAVASLIKAQGIPFGRTSHNETSSVLLVDQMGKLQQCYREATLAFVGGSFAPKVGGHNILEPCFYGKPVLFGPYMHSQPDFLMMVKRYQAGFQITEKNLVPQVVQLLSQPDLYASTSTNGLRLLSESRGASEKSLKGLLKMLES